MKTSRSSSPSSSDKAADATRRAPAPSRALDAGVHAIGKKVVEEAAEVVDGRRARGHRARRRGDLPAALPRAGADARARARRSTTSTRISEPSPHPTSTARRPHAAHRRPQQGLAVRARRARCCTRPATGSARDAKELVAASTPTTTSSSSTCARATSRSTSAPGTLDVGITGRDLLLDSGAEAEEILPLGFAALDLPLRRPARHAPTTSPDLDGHARRHRPTPGWSRRTSPSTASTPTVDPPRRRGRDRRPARRRRRRSPTSSRPARTLRKAGPGDLRRADPAVRGGPDPPRGRRAADRRSTSWCAGCRASWSPART